MQRLIKEIKACQDEQLGFAALALALIIPNVCATFCKGETAKRRDYIDWCKKWVKGVDNLDADAIYAIRCAFLHALDADLNEQPIFNEHLEKKASSDETRVLSYRLYFPHLDAREAVICGTKNGSEVKHTLCTGLLVGAIIDAYERFEASTPSFSHEYKNLWFEG